MKDGITLCIVGKGAAGWMACNLFKIKDYIKKIIIIGSDNIPTIGVGESNTLELTNFHRKIGCEQCEFVKKSDAAVKYGVFYNNWGKNDFLHFFRGSEPWSFLGITATEYGKLLSNKDKNTSLHSLYGEKLFSFTQKNLVSLDINEYPISWHFDASLYIEYLKEMALKTKKVYSINEKVVSCNISVSDHSLKSLVLENGEKIKSDYFIFASGDSNLSDKFLKNEYEDLSKFLITDTAVVFPLEYTDKKNQFHPYTVAKTMKYGWRWITPTYSRIGTGYVFSSKYVSEDEAIREFLSDIGDFTITPKVVKFKPGYNKNTFEKNYCSIGMANGFLEPLDAPGITITIDVLYELERYFSLLIKDFDQDAIESVKDIMNQNIETIYKFWSAFIFSQYKTCHRNDSVFWNDYKNIKYNYYDNMINNLDIFDTMDNMMFYHTMSGKDVSWKTNYTKKPFKIFEEEYPKEHHLDFIENIRK